MAAKDTATPNTPPVKKTKMRSPAYPGINLETALKRAAALYKNERRNEVPYPVAVSHWGFGAKSSGGLVSVAALKSFGLLQDVERGAAGRVVKLSDLGFQILLDERPDSEERAAAIKRAALLPKAHAAIWRKYGTTEGVSDANLKHDLVFNFKFNENIVEEFIKEYKDTIRFAKLADSDTISTGLEDKDQEEEETDGVEKMQETPSPQQFARKDPPAPPAKQQAGRIPVGNEIPVAADCVMGVNATGRVTQGGIDKLIAYLQLIKGSFPSNGESGKGEA